MKIHQHWLYKLVLNHQTELATIARILDVMTFAPSDTLITALTQAVWISHKY